MKIFIRNIPTNTSLSEISKFIKSSFDNSKPRSYRKIKEAKIVSQQIYSYSDDYKLTYHGLIKLKPDKVARRTITRLNKTFFKGRKILLREFSKRSWKNDKRCHAPSEYYRKNNRRKMDRRHENLENTFNLIVMANKNKRRL